MSDTILFLAITLNVRQSENEPEGYRKKQYIDGITRLFELIGEKVKEMDIIIYENSGDKIDEDIKKLLPEKTIIISKEDNELGSKNKGAGIIKMWLDCKDIIRKYKWFIHFEPRQLLKSFYFFDKFFENKRNLFVKETDDLIRTGLFAINVEELMEIFNEDDIENMIKNTIAIEKIFLEKMNERRSEVEYLDKLDLMWFRTYNIKKRRCNYINC